MRYGYSKIVLVERNRVVLLWWSKRAYKMRYGSFNSIRFCWILVYGQLQGTGIDMVSY